MDLFITTITILISCLAVENQIYLYQTEDGRSIEYYDCVIAQSLLYCRRPEATINLSRENDTELCKQNGGRLHHFNELQSNNTTVSTILHHWRSSVERVEQYSIFLRDPPGIDGSLCQCLQPASFGKNCEYQLPFGEILEETLGWQLIMRKENSEKVQIYGDVVCYETLGCDSGVLCLDWRDICDGFQHCMSGRDEENCDLLEMNVCDGDEYRCMNGMCIPDQYFLDGDLDCLDWSDEMPLKRSETCFLESVSAKCDDHICRPNHWPCGDGQCILNRLAFQKSEFEPTCQSGREQYFMCEIRLNPRQWTMSNGRCCQSEECQESSPIPYPRKAVITPYMFFLYDRTQDGQSKGFGFIEINGTVRCGHSLIAVTKLIPFHVNLDPCQITEEHFCRPFRSNLSSSEISKIHKSCHHANESTNLCNEWNPCYSITRISDGSPNCPNRTDENERKEAEIEKSCASVRRHRFRCSTEQPTCLSILAVGNGIEYCRNKFDEFLFGTGRTLTLMLCNDRRHDECSLLRPYIEQSWKSTNQTESDVKLRIAFRSHCDTFNNLQTRDDENHLECRRWWICPEDQRQCGTGQCVEQRWFNDGEWDCPDASDEYEWMRHATNVTLRRASGHNFTDQSYFVPSTCPQSDQFLCLSSNATRQGFSCLNLSQIGDGQIDCAGAIDERNTLRHCSKSSSMLESHFLCPSTNTCIPYLSHCRPNQRCPNRSDDEFWCSRQKEASNCSQSKDFVCFDGRRFKGGRCDRSQNCLFAEDEYMCDYPSAFSGTVVPYRQEKRSSQGNTHKVLRFPPYPTNLNISQLDSPLIDTRPLTSTSNSLSPYWCNRGFGVLTAQSQSIVCLCPPQYYGEKCEYHQDRLSVLFHLNLSRSIYSSSEGNSPSILLKLLVLFLLNDEVLDQDQFHLHPSFEQTDFSDNDDRNKFTSYFPYPRWTSALRRERFFNRSLLRLRPFSVRIELYRTERDDQQPSLISVWKYPVDFDYLPVTRLAKVLHFAESTIDPDPCSSHSCHPNARCHRLMNNRSHFICLCKANFTAPHCSFLDPQCFQGYCSQGSLCQPNSKSPPFCLCPRNRFGPRCSIENDRCRSNPCRNNGTCFPNAKPGQVICLCSKRYTGSLCQKRRMSIDLSLSTDLSHRAAAIQFFEINLSSLDLILLHQHVSPTVPQQIEYLHYDDLPVTGIVLAKLYSPDEDLHLLSVYLNASAVRGVTAISSINRCEHLRTFSDVPLSPIRYHQLCILNPGRLCFRDDVYLCLCAENHTRVECFLYNDQLDRCSQCLNGGRCLRGDVRRSSDYLCLCPECYFGRRCQSNTRSFSFTLDQLFSADLQSSQREATLPLLIFFSLFTFLLAVPNNLFSFVTFRRRRCLRQGVGHYLLWMSVVNQINLGFLVVRLLHLIIQISDTSPSSTSDDLLCKSLNYLLSSSTRLVYWLASLVSIERLYITLSLRGQWLKQPHIARRLILFIFSTVFIADLYELFFYQSFSSPIDGHGSICLLQISTAHRSRWMTFHLLFLILHSLLPLLINLFSTITISLIVVNKKINTFQIDPTRVDQSMWMKMRDRLRLIVDVLSENKEFVLGPAVTLVPQLFSLPLFISSFILDCRNLDDSWLRHFLIVSYWISFTPQWTSFFLYIVPSSLYSSEWRKADLHRWMDRLLRQQSPAPATAATFSVLSSVRYVIKDAH